MAGQTSYLPYCEAVRTTAKQRLIKSGAGLFVPARLVASSEHKHPHLLRRMF